MVSVLYTRTVVVIHAWPSSGIWSQWRDNCVDGSAGAGQGSSAVPVLYVFFLVLALGNVRLGDLGCGVLGSGLLAVDFGDGFGDVFAGEGEGGVDIFAPVVEPCLELEGC
jgi:hypothetical protein